MIKTQALVLLIVLFFFARPALAQEKVFEAKVNRILAEKEIELETAKQVYQEIELLITNGEKKGELVVVESGGVAMVNLPRYQLNDQVLVTMSQGLAGEEIFYITDYLRRDILIFLFLIFVCLTIVVGGWQGVSSLLGMGASFLVIFQVILPLINRGFSPVLAAILGSLLIVPVTFYLSHGVNRKTTIAIFATAAALIITGILALIFVNMARLTGFASEEAGFLQSLKEGAINIKGLLLAGIIIGALGVLDDITVSQAAIVEQLKKTKPKMKTNELSWQAMAVGRDHIASMVNTLILVYTGAALPLLLLFIDSPRPFSEVINYELIASEIVRTLVGSIGLIAAVPITTFLAAWQATKK